LSNKLIKMPRLHKSLGRFLSKNKGDIF
jgi:hypothetical protein